MGETAPRRGALSRPGPINALSFFCRLLRDSDKVEVTRRDSHAARAYECGKHEINTLNPPAPSLALSSLGRTLRYMRCTFLSVARALISEVNVVSVTHISPLLRNERAAGTRWPEPAGTRIIKSLSHRPLKFSVAFLRKENNRPTDRTIRSREFRHNLFHSVISDALLLAANPQ